MADNPVIGRSSCHECKETILVKTNKNGIAYYFCDCGAHAKWSRKTSTQMKAKHARMERQGKPEAANDNEIGIVKGDDNELRTATDKQSEPATPATDGGEGKPERRGGILGDW